MILVLIQYGSYCTKLGRGDTSNVSCHRSSSLLRRFQAETGRCTIIHMLKITFIPDNEDFSQAAKAYTDLWANDGNRITENIEKVAGKEFKERNIEGTVFEGISQSNPLKLRASYDDNTKKATLVHELLHRISAEYMFNLPDKNEDLSLGLHKQIDLVLYDLWTELYGREFADEQVAIESKRTSVYKEAWDWALNFQKHDRQKIFVRLRS